jgi:LPS-assembly lipoprotein
MATKRAFLCLAVLLLTACGFHLRGQTSLSFHSIYLSAPNLTSPFISELRRNLLANKVALATSAEQADVILDIVSENTEKQVLTLGADGRVNEYRLIYRVSLRAYNQQQQDWIPAEEMTQRRDFSYDDTQILAKEAEESLLYQSMRSDMVQQILRRLSHAKPTPIARESE